VILDLNARPRRRVTIIKTVVKQYRAIFFERLTEALSADGVELKILFGSPSGDESAKADNVNLPASLGLRIPSRYLAGNRLLVQWPGLIEIARSDLIVVVNANRNLLNIPLLLLSWLGLKKVALWGHGYNHQGIPNSVSERLKKKLAVMPNWWFAYTTQTARYLVSLGFRADKITTIDNAIDTSGFSAMVQSVTAEEVAAMRSRLNLSARDRIGLYCGSLYPEKRIPFLLSAAAKIASRIPDFRLVIIGTGIEEATVRKAAEELGFIRYAGPMFGKEKAVCYKMAEVILNPGLVGLAILDAFAAGLPVVALSDSLHSPEIAYLEHGVNGLMVQGGMDEYVAASLRLLEDEKFNLYLRIGAEQTRSRYTVENMVRNVRAGILQCLDSRTPEK